MALVSCLYLYYNRSYSRKCVVDLFGDLDFVLDQIVTRNNRLLAVSLVYVCAKYLKSISKIHCRVPTDRQTNQQTNLQT